MNLLKNFGGAAPSMMAGMSTAKPQASKPTYFSKLKLEDEPPPKQKSKPPAKRGPPKDFVPNKFALSFDPPCISTFVFIEFSSTEILRTRNYIITK